jgi:putative colanic acid biosynthesis UDP-glucose lipid carrier transferase
MMSETDAPAAPEVAASPVAVSFIKRAFDVVVALLIIFFLLPILVATAICVALDSRGPILFRQRRTGLNGQTFYILKFRSMTVMEDDGEIRHATKGDQRVTSVGRFIRRSSIDELPQLFNVIRGEMSLVGPRPHALAHDEHYGALIPQYKDRFRARPGITGLAQISGLRGEIRGVAEMGGRITADNRYIDDWNPLMDLMIIAKTAVVTLRQTGAY